MVSAPVPSTSRLLEFSDVSGYSQRQPANTIVWQTVHKHWQAYRAETARCHEGRPPSAFVEAAAKKFLACGFHSSGFARIRCTSCGDAPNSRTLL